MTTPSLDDLAALGREFRAGGTDLMSRTVPSREYADLSGTPELTGIEWSADGSARIGALTTVAEIAEDALIRAAYPALAGTAAGLATPQVRAAGTVGGNLLQRNRCAYFRNPAFSCHQDGGDSCPARAGTMLNPTVIESGPCLAPHPSSLAMALIGYDATAEVRGRGAVPVRDLYGDDPGADHLLAPGEILVGVGLPVPVPGERAAYHRAIGRAEAEWPLVEATARVVVEGDRITLAAVAVGGVARTPLRLPEVEAALLAGEPLDRAAALAADRCSPSPDAAYKVALLTGTVLEVLERCLDD
ncbi:FAD-binding molybdopterin dehydrogenase [Microtetraspora sp. NBRC 13810]|uniref:FAD binding domain-containing protein n=1 Tax=Microtetraspora sp. NBRC 13810 TaxID=3030990 RepID=UPI002553967E|nr:FAD binding domain-containing protein [Microtetraspora sp. NBRC 13810]GLW09008.1 FAD-binding molybdopterin dehydrogenase [Microtetraspora sp. NBRC 13810]